MNVYSVILVPSSLQFPMMYKPDWLVSRHALVAYEPLSVHDWHMLSAQSCSSMATYLLVGPGVGAGGAEPHVAWQVSVAHDGRGHAKELSERSHEADASLPWPGTDLPSTLIKLFPSRKR